ncbi:MAG: phosphoribosylformylglycinamidine synthase subunit PurQ [Deltaproteobacteria bacterium]|nr:phosphoribosylformylglycinamidine synthase subunit PurQ [Deltaproteobacteria bacterium]
MRVSVVVFPGSNCDHDVIHLYQKVLGSTVSSIWHRDRDLKKPDIVIIPGGFSYGDYLRTGAMAKLSPVMSEVAKFAEQGGSVLGICNGFQILCECGLLPGVLLQNIGMQFLSRFVSLRVENNSTTFSRNYVVGEVLTCPIAHGEGNYFADREIIQQLEDEGRVVFRYCSPSGEVDSSNLNWNPNGSINSIAGICSAKGNVVGLMPHPERSSEKIVGFVGEQSGVKVFQ